MILLGRRIKELRNNAKLTQTELAHQVGVTKSTIAAYENDSRLPSYEVLIRMSNTFKVSIDSILLDHPGSILEVHGLNPEQLHILETLIVTFRQNNTIDTLYTTSLSETPKRTDYYINLSSDKSAPPL